MLILIIVHLQVLNNCGLCNRCMVVLVMHPICRCQVPGSRRWKKTMYVQTVSVSGCTLRRKRISQKFSLCLDSEQHAVQGYCGSSSCYSVTVSANLLLASASCHCCSKMHPVPKKLFSEKMSGYGTVAL